MGIVLSPACSASSKSQELKQRIALLQDFGMQMMLQLKSEINYLQAEQSIAAKTGKRGVSRYAAAYGAAGIDVPGDLQTV